MPKLPETMTIPQAGKHYYGLSKNGSYDAAKAGIIPTVKAGKKIRRVPTRLMEKRLNNADAPTAAEATTTNKPK
jgi:hypothetical protein